MSTDVRSSMYPKADFAFNTVNKDIFVLFLRKTVKIHICDVNSSQQGHNLHTSENDQVIFSKFPFRETLYQPGFTKIEPDTCSRYYNITSDAIGRHSAVASE